jgi:hypothetical protein
MSPRLQRRDWLQMQRFARCESSTTCREVASELSLAHRCICSHSRRFARGLMNRVGLADAARSLRVPPEWRQRHPGGAARADGIARSPGSSSESPCQPNWLRDPHSAISTSAWSLHQATGHRGCQIPRQSTQTLTQRHGGFEMTQNARAPGSWVAVFMSRCRATSFGVLPRTLQRVRFAAPTFARPSARVFVTEGRNE